MWSLFEGKKELKPKIFSNGKNQQNIVEEVVSEIKKGRKIIFIHGVCGSGKSAIALNIAKELGKTSIVVPIKNLQKQYEKDYTENKHVIRGNGKKLKISMISGRRNHTCIYLGENKEEIMNTRKVEKNSNLYDIFKRKDENFVNNEDSCDNPILPCKIEIKNKNINTLKKYYKDNPEHENFNLDLKLMKRLAIAPSCPYWSPILNSDMKVKLNSTKRDYISVNGKYSLHLRKEGCPYYKQFNSYIDSDVILFNSHQYLLETLIGRKPLTEVEIIDECDEFLDNFAVEGSINLNRLRNELFMIPAIEPEQKKLLDSLMDDVVEAINEAQEKINHEENIFSLEKTKIRDLIRAFVKSDLFDIDPEDTYINNVLETSRKFYELIPDSYASFYKDKKNGDLNVRLVTTHLEKLLNSLLEKNKAFVFMSGTLHSERILREIFGMKDFKVIDAETFNQGTITKVKTGLEMDFKYDNFSNGRVTREQYLRALDKCIEIAKRPTIIHVNAFQDLPSEFEISELGLKNIISSQKLINEQKEDKQGNLVYDFKQGKTNILFTTRCSRGIDFPFETCNSVIITKFPYPNTQSLFWRVLKKNKPEMFWEFYKDKASRELLQRIYRSVRAENDHVFLLSPDIRVLNSNIR